MKDLIIIGAGGHGRVIADIAQKLGVYETISFLDDGDAKESMGLPIVGKFPACPDVAASGLWSTPKELLSIAKEFVAAYGGKSDFLQGKSARAIAMPVEKFPWTGLGIFVVGEDILMTQGWGENGQCMMKMNCLT